LKESTKLQKVLFYLGVLSVLLALIGQISYQLRFYFKPSDWILVSIVFLLLSLDAKSGSTFLGK
jgi:hypothetical protein